MAFNIVHYISSDLASIVEKIEQGAGRHANRMGALHVKDKDGIKFKVGTGFSDKDRENRMRDIHNISLGTICCRRILSAMEALVANCQSSITSRLHDINERYYSSDRLRRRYTAS